MKKYDSYKDSGVEWIGDIPSHWRKSKFKFVSDLYTGNSLNDSQKLQYESENLDDLPYVSSKDIDVEFQTVKYNNGLRIPRINNPLKISPKGSFLMVIEGGSSGRKKVYLEQDVCFVNKLCSFNSRENTKFQYYFIQSSNYQDKFKLSMSGLIGGVSISKLKDFELTLPPLSEQHQIVSFLDTKTSLIDSLIEKTQQKVELLKEKRTSLINEVITMGLNPNVEMKNSGVEWIGQIPVHWEIKPLFTVSEYSKEKNHDGETTVLTLSYGKLKTRNVELNFGLLPESFDSYQRVRPGYIILRLMDLQNDKKSLRVGHSFLDGIITSVYVGLKCKSNMLSEFLYYHLHNSDIKKVLYSLGGGLRQTLRFDELKRFPVPIFPIEEQQQIVDYLNEQTRLIDKTSFY